MIGLETLFGPNDKTLRAAEGGEHHRGPWYRSLLRETVSLFKEKFSVPAENDVLLLTGSGTLANQAALYTFGGHWATERPDLEFGARLKRFLQAERLFKAESANTAWVLYDTDTSTLCEPPRKHPSGLWMVDCVSAFPYYPAPSSADVWTTVSSKQLGALPVLGVVVVSPRAWEAARWAAEDHYSYLNLRRWRVAQLGGESPYTPAIPLVEDLRDVLEKFDRGKFVEKIDRRRAECVAVLGSAARGTGPVLTLTPGAVQDDLATKYDLYRRRGGGHQVFLWAGTDEQYAKFLMEVS